MNDNWIEIVESLKPYFATNPIEGKYQHEIENCLKMLGWKKSNGTMEPQLTLQIGNSNSIRPDIVLQHNDGNECLRPVLPIEIKRPCNVHTEKQDGQLKSYMRQLRLNVGLYIGESIQLFYDNPDDLEPPVCVLFANIDSEDMNGEILCDLLNYSEFSYIKLETFCRKQYDELKAKQDIHQRMLEFFNGTDSISNILKLLKEKIVNEGFDAGIVEEELKKVTISAHYGIQEQICPNPSILPSDHSLLNDSKKFSDNRNPDRTQYSFGKDYYGKGRFVLELIKQFIADHDGISFSDLITYFPDYLHSKTLGVIRRYEDVRLAMVNNNDLGRRYFLKPQDRLKLKDGTEVIVNNQWGATSYFPRFLEFIKSRGYYHISSR